MEQEFQAAAEPPGSWINFKFMPCFILNHKFNNSVLAHGKPTVSTWKQSYPYWSYWWTVQALPSTKNAPSQLTKRDAWKTSLPTRKWDFLQASPSGPSRKEKRHFPTDRSRWYSSTGWGCSLQPPLSSLKSLAQRRICWALQCLPEDELLELVQFTVP